MADFLAICRDQNRVSVAQARIAGSEARITRAAVLDIPGSIELESAPQAAGKWLAGELQQRGFSARNVLVGLPRDDVITRQLELPEAPEDELPDLVRMQAATKTTTPLDDLVLDFLPLPQHVGASGRSVLMATMTRKRLQTMGEICRAADLEPAVVTVSLLGDAELLSRAQTQGDHTSDPLAALVVRQGARLEIVIMQGHRVLRMHALRIAPEGQAAIDRTVMAEINRLLVALRRTRSGASLERLWLLGDDAESPAYHQALRERFSGEIAALPLGSLTGLQLPDDPLPPDLHFGLPGMLAAQAGGWTIETLNFLEPRKRILKPDRRNLKRGLIAAGIAILLLSVWGGVQIRAMQMDDEIEKQRTALREMEAQLKQSAPEVAAAGVVEEWSLRNINLLRQTSRLAGLLPGTDRVYLDDYRFEPSRGTVLARIRASGFARDRADIEDLYQRLSEQSYRVRPQAIRQSRLDPDYPYRFELDLELPLPQVNAPGSAVLAAD